MAHALPLTKLASLLIKTFAKPLSKNVKHQFSRNKMTQNFLVGIGQANHQVTSRLTIWSSGYRVRSITALERTEALKTGADFVGETIVVGVSAGLVVWEYNRSATSNKKKEEAKRADAKAERDALNAKLITLDVRLKALEEVVNSNSQSILGLGSKGYKAPKNVVLIRDSIEEEQRTGRAVTKVAEDEESLPERKGLLGLGWFGL